jgi:hypothetical protein
MPTAENFFYYFFLFTMFCKFAAISDCYICLSVAFKPFLFLLIAEGTNLPTDN